MPVIIVRADEAIEFGGNLYHRFRECPVHSVDSPLPLYARVTEFFLEHPSDFLEDLSTPQRPVKSRMLRQPQQCIAQRHGSDYTGVEQGGIFIVLVQYHPALGCTGPLRAPLPPDRRESRAGRYHAWLCKPKRLAKTRLCVPTMWWVISFSFSKPTKCVRETPSSLAASTVVRDALGCRMVM